MQARVLIDIRGGRKLKFRTAGRDESAQRVRACVGGHLHVRVGGGERTYQFRGQLHHVSCARRVLLSGKRKRGGLLGHGLGVGSRIGGEQDCGDERGHGVDTPMVQEIVGAESLGVVHGRGLVSRVAALEEVLSCEQRYCVWNRELVNENLANLNIRTLKIEQHS